jgi:hypothetical protein
MRSIRSVPEGSWDQPGLGVWNVRELCVHACRAWLTTLQYSADTAELTMHTSLDYFRVVLDAPGDIHADVAERARATAAELDEPVPTYAARLLHEVQALLEGTPDDRVIATFAGGIRFIDYLPTRVLELVVHGIDICDAVGTEPDVPPTAGAVAIGLLGSLAIARLEPARVAGLVRGLTGRAAFPGELNLLA